MKFLFILIVVCLGFVAQAEASTPRTIGVSGVCDKKVMPDRGRINLTITESEPDVKSASKKAMEAYEELRKAVKAMKLKDVELETSEYSVQEQVEWVKNKKIHKGFQSRMGLTVSTSDIQRLGDVMVVASKLGVQDVGAMMTYLSTGKMRSSHEECLKEAIQNARAKAEKMANAVGGHIGEVISIDETARAVAGPRYFAEAQEDMDMTASNQPAPGIETKAEEVSVNISMSVELK